MSARKVTTRIFDQKRWYNGEHRWHGCMRVSVGKGLVLEVRTADNAKYSSRAALTAALSKALKQATR